MIKKILILLCIPFSAYSQVPERYWIAFTDKNNSAFSVATPSAYLSSRAIGRRAKYGIPVQANDLPINSNYIDSVRTRGAKILNRSRWLNGITIELQNPSDINNILLLPFVKQHKKIAYRVKAPLNDIEKFSVETPFNPKTNDGINKTSGYNYGPSANQISMLGGITLHDNGFRGDGVIIALLDAGFYKVDSLPAFDSLRANNQILGTWDFVDDHAGVYEDNSHGMNVLSTIGGNLPGMLVGTAPRASFYLLRTEDVFSEYIIEEYNWVAGAEFADSAGADIISSSLGYTLFNDPIQDHFYSSMDGNTCPSSVGADIAASKGLIVLNSAGNEGMSPWRYIGAPSDGDSVLAIGAVDAFRNHAFFSSHGPSYDGRVKPDVAAQGYESVVASTGGGTNLANGTSFSCPITAGMTACLLQAHPLKTNIEIIKAIQKSGDRYSNPDTLTGYGIPDFSKAANILTGITDHQNSDDNVYVSPNPFTDHVSVMTGSLTGNVVNVEIIDITGRKTGVSNYNINKNIINISGLDVLSNGIYFIKVTTVKNSIYKKVLKN